MTVTAVRRDPATLSLAITTELAATPARVWQLWADPRQLERWWGPPVYPATVTRHDLRPGGHVAYHMTGPEGDRHGGYWEIVEVEPARRIHFRNGFATDDGSVDPTLPATETRVEIEAIDAGRTRMTVTSVFPSLEALEQLLAMGMEEGMTLAVGQIDAILTEAAVPGA